MRALVRRLIEEAAGTSGEGPPGGEPLLDVEVDGFRCTLVQAPEEGHAASSADPAEPAELLSPREREVARMVAKGLPNKTIAAVLEISPWTVNTHLRRIFAKLDVQSRAAMVSVLHERGTFRE